MQSLEAASINMNEQALMADIFISYSKQEAELTIALASDLEQQGYTTWWDTQLLPGDHFRDTIKKQIDAAKAVIVIWTPISVLSKWVYSEAQMADDQNKLITVCSENMKPQNIPLLFNSYYTAKIDERQKIFFACRQYFSVNSVDSATTGPNINNLPSVIRESINNRYSLDDITLFANNILTRGYSNKAKIKQVADIHEADIRHTIHPNGDTYVESRFHLNSTQDEIYFWTYWINANPESDSIQFNSNSLHRPMSDNSNGLLSTVCTLLPTPRSRFTIFNHRVRQSRVQQSWCYAKGDETWQSLAAKPGEEPGVLRWWGLI